jgi:DNA polymerase III subunit epsilon
MRQIVLDTETTGLDAALGHRIIELAGIELVNRQNTKNNFHRYLNPERLNDVGALQVHGLSDDFLKDQPKFREVVAEFLEYIAGAELIIHNAAFDLAFLNRELSLLNHREIEHYCPSIIDTLRLAKDIHPGKRNNLDALCERYDVDNTGRVLHGALLDAELLAEVYLAMTRGQESLIMEVSAQSSTQITSSNTISNLELLVLRASAEELESHRMQLLEIDGVSGGRCLWK